MKNSSLVFFFLFFLSLKQVSAQTPVIEWQRIFGGNNGDYAKSIVPTTDGGYIVSGYTGGLDNGDIMGFHGNFLSQDNWIIKLNHEGQIEWQKCLGGTFSESLGFIQQTADGGYIFVGSSSSHDIMVTGNHGNYDFWIVRLTSAGEIVWQKSFGGSRNENPWGITLTTDGGYIIAGDSESTDGDLNGNHGLSDFWIIKIDSIGNLQWQKNLGGSGWDAAFSVTATPDGGCVAAGYTESSDGDVTGYHGLRDYWVVKLSGTGNLQWQKSLGGSEFDGAWSVKYTKTGGLIVAGYSNSNNGDVSGNHQALGKFSDMWVVKLNISGAIEWQKCYGGLYGETAYNVQEAPDGGYLVCGETWSANGGDLTCPNEGVNDMWVFKISDTGILQWQKSFGGNYFDQAFCVEPTTDGGCVVAGTTCSKNLDGFHPQVTFEGTCDDFWIIKLSPPLATAPAPIVTIDPADASVCANGNAVFKASVKYAGLRPVYQWKKNGIVVGTNSSTYTASGLTNNDVVSCAVKTSSECGNSSLTATGAVTVKVIIPTGTQSIHVSASQTVLCNNSSTVSFTANVTNAGPSSSYRWKVNGIAAGRDANIFQSSSLKNGDVITCEYIDNLSCSGFIMSNAITINSGTILPTLTIAASKVAICTGEQVQFTATAINGGSNPSYQWKVNGVNVGTNQPVFTTAALNNNDAVSCIITSDPLFSCSSILTATSNKIQVSVKTKTNPSITVTSSANSICIGEQVQFTATAINAGSNPSYQWKVNGLGVGTNQPVFTTAALNNNDAVSCFITGDPLFTCISTQTVASNKIQVAVNGKTNPSITVSSSAVNNCTGTAVTFVAKTTNAGKSPAYQWKINGVDAGNNDSVFTSNTLKNGDKVSCVLAVDPAYTCTSSSSLSSNTIDMQQSIATITVTTFSNAICEGETVSFKAVAANAGTNPTYSWNVNSIAAGGNSDIFSSASLKNGDQVSCLLVPGVGGCSASPVTSGNIVMNVYSLPLVSITPVDTFVAQNSRVQFQTVTTEPPANFIWSPPQLFINPAALSPQTIPLADNSSFTLRVMNVNGCETEKKVNVSIYRALMMPNAFTPNGDGLNDLFVIPLNVDLKLSEFVVYNRWGQLVFSTNAIGKGWDGTFRGMPAEQGLYNYFIKGTNERGVIRINGTILLIRQAS